MTFDEHSSHMKEVIKNFKTTPAEILEKETEYKKPPPWCSAILDCY